MKIAYPIILKPEKEAVNVVFPDLMGVVTDGKNKNEALINAYDALKVAYEAEMLIGTTPSSLAKIKELFPKYEAYLIEIEV